MLKKIFVFIRVLWQGLFFGMKNADKSIMGVQQGNNIIIDVVDEKGGVYKDILEEKVTQEVEELRYSSYKVANESMKYRYVGNGVAVKKENLDLKEKHCKIDESDGLSVILIQDNLLVCEDVLSCLSEVDKTDNKKLYDNYTLKIVRDNIPRFRIENFIKKFVLKESDGNYVLDLYCSKYPKQFSTRIDKSFLSELKRIKVSGFRDNDIFDFKEISFVTFNAWGVDNWYRFSFIEFEYNDIIEFDGNYIIRLGCQSNVFNENLLDKIYSESCEKKYKNKEKRKNSTIYFDSYVDNSTNVENERKFIEEIKKSNISEFLVENDNNK